MWEGAGVPGPWRHPGLRLAAVRVPGTWARAGVLFPQCGRVESHLQKALNVHCHVPERSPALNNVTLLVFCFNYFFFFSFLKSTALYTTFDEVSKFIVC